jgi:AcrR family transcriptional regulator
LLIQRPATLPRLALVVDGIQLQAFRESGKTAGAGDKTLASKIVEKILDGATELFAEQGYYGPSTKEIALRADVTEPSIFRLFLTKEKLFHECLISVVNRSLQPAQFGALISTPERGEDFTVTASRAVRRWYFSLPFQSALLLMQAALSDNKEWAEIAYSRIDKIIQILAKSIEQEAKIPKTGAVVAARTLILALFQFKIARPMLTSGDRERDAVEDTIDQWCRGVLRKTAV